MKILTGVVFFLFFFISCAKMRTVYETEPNDSLIDASILKVNGLTLGYFRPDTNQKPQPERDYDYYIIQGVANAGSDMRLSVDLSETGSHDAAMEILDSKGQRIKYIDREGSGGAEYFDNLRQRYGENLYLKIFCKKEICCRENAQPYKIFCERTRAGSETELEPNDTLHTASVLPAEQEEIQGSLSSGDDIDYYIIYNKYPDGMLLSPVVHPAADTDVVMFLSDNFGNEIKRIDNGGPGHTEFVPDMHVFNESYYLLIRYPEQKNTTNSSEPAADENDNSDPGKLMPSEKNIFKPSGKYIVKRTIKPFAEGFESEPNDRQSMSTRIRSGQIYSGTISHAEDMDWFEFNIYSPGNYHAEIIRAAQTPAAVHIIHQLGASVTNIISQDTHTALKWKAEQGTWYIRLSHHGSNKPDPSEVYRFRISEHISN